MTAETNVRPGVSIVLPTYNRAGFLSAAFTSLTQQTFRDWELIVVDDGSTDDTCAVVARFAETSGRPVRYIYQENRGPAAARNAGVAHTRAPYLAFYDSDDVWLPGYLERSVGALRDNADVDWVFSSCRMVDLDTGAVVAPNTFYVDGSPRPFLGLQVDRSTARAECHRRPPGAGVPTVRWDAVRAAEFGDEAGAL